MITSRDFEVVEFIKDVKIASTSTISQLFFPSLRMAQNRLNVMCSANLLRRSRDTVSSEYVYYSSRPKQFRHSLLVSDFYRELSKISTVHGFRIEPTYDDIRPDAVFGYEIGSKKYLGLLEVEISNKGLDLFKYNKLYANDQFKKFFPTMPVIFVVSDLKELPDTPYKTVLVDTSFGQLPVRLGIRLLYVGYTNRQYVH